MLRFSIAYWHSFRGSGADTFGPGTIERLWERGSDPISTAKHRMDAAFEFFTKIGVKYWCFHDLDIAPEGATLAETNRNLDVLVAHAAALQDATGIARSGALPIVLASPVHVRCCDQSGCARIRPRGRTG